MERAFGSAEKGKPRVANGDLSRDEVLKQCALLPAGALWEDKVFGHIGDKALYRSPRGITFNKGKPVRWLRPRDFCGGPERVALVKGGAEAGDVCQGELGDCYLLGAMSSIAAKGLVPHIRRSDEDVASDLAKGFVTFYLYKYGERVECTVDTLLPCDSASGKPIFAHGKDLGEVWVPLLEKACAKLYGSYEALDGGTVTAALSDLTGGVGEAIDLADDDSALEIADGSMWKRLLRYAAKQNYLLGASLSRSDVEDGGSAGDTQVSEGGILVNHAYTLLAVREVHAAGEVTRLVQLRNPWGMREWNGAWKDHGREWDTPAGQRAFTELGVTFGDDGTFWIEWADFQQHFTQVYVCRVLSYRVYDARRVDFVPGHFVSGAERQWYRYEVEGEWTADNAGGCFNFPQWRKNPQYEIVAMTGTEAYLLLMQPDPRLDDRRAEDTNKIGMYLMRGHERMRRKVLYDSEEIEGDDVVDSTPFIPYREVQCNTMDEEAEDPLDGRYVLCPSTFHPMKLGGFRLVLYTSQPLLQPPQLLSPLRHLSVAGAWSEINAGGCRNHGASWRKNEQYLFTLQPGSRASLVLYRESAVSDSDTAAFSSKRSKAASKKHKPKDPAEFYIGFVVCEADAPGCKRLHVGAEAEIDKTAYTTFMEIGREFVSAGGGSYLVVPTTWMPSKLSDYSLALFTDDPTTTLQRLSHSGYHEHEARGEWLARSSGGSRNHTTWVLNPLYKLRAAGDRPTTCHTFLRQPHAQEGAGYEGIGFYVVIDDGELQLEDVIVQSGFRQAQEVSRTFTLEPHRDYLLIPMTYRRGVLQPFNLQLYADAPGLRLVKLSEYESDSRRLPALRAQCARTIQRVFARHLIWRLLRARAPDNQQRARAMMIEWFRTARRDNDEGYVDLNAAMDALEAAFVQLTGDVGHKGAFFPDVRAVVRARGHKVADYDVCVVE